MIKIYRFTAPPTWTQITRDGRSLVIVTCPNGHMAGLDDHEVADDGTVTPSLECPSCDFHDSVKLIGYTP